MPTDDHPTTHALIERAQRGDAAALEALMQRHLPDLRVYVRAKSGPTLRRLESDSDLVQTVCREALGSLEQYEWQGEGSFRYWLFSVALHKLRNKHDYYQAAKRNPALRVDADAGFDWLAQAYHTLCTPSQHAVAQEIVERVEAALDRIDPQLRDIIVCSRIVGLSHAEIAEKLGKNEGAVRTALSRALTKLAGAMQAVEREGSRRSEDPPITGG